jgi:FixJ family two-component response regulator
MSVRSVDVTPPEGEREAMISIVDDDTVVREATSNLIRSHGFAAANFTSAEDFLQSDAVDDTACLILDVQLPGLSGIELQKRLRAQGRRTPVIFVTAFPEARLKARAIAGGAVAFLDKPYDAQDLIDCVGAALRGRAN